MKKMIFKLMLAVCLLNIQSLYSQNLVKYYLNGKIGFKNQSGVIIVPAKYDQVGDFSEGIAKVAIGDKYGSINQIGKEIIPVKYESIGKCSEGLISYRYEVGSGIYQNGYFNKKGTVEFYYQPEKSIVMFTNDFSDEVAIIQMTAVIAEYLYITAYSCINKQGELLFDFDEDIRSVEPFSEGYSAVRFSDNKWGYINKQGQLAISKRWDDAKSFKNGKAEVMIKEKNTEYDDYDEYSEEYLYWYYSINKNGDIIENLN